MQDMFSLEGKTALVTGAAYGIGFAIAQALAMVGARIAFNCRSQENPDQALADYAALGIDAKGYFGLLPPKDVDVFEKLMLTPDRCCGIFPLYFALEALARYGKFDTFYQFLTRNDAYGWKNMLREGATACFETWGKDQKWNTSLCHPWASSPIGLIIEDIAGVKPVSGGFRFSPHIPECISEFDLTIPLQGERYRITLINNELKIKRMESNADTANE